MSENLSEPAEVNIGLDFDTEIFSPDAKWAGEDVTVGERPPAYWQFVQRQGGPTPEQEAGLSIPPRGWD